MVSQTLLARNLPFDSDVRQLSHPLVTSLHCLWHEPNNVTCGQFECDVTWFCLDFGARSCCFIVCLRFQVVQIKQVDCNMSTKNANNYK